MGDYLIGLTIAVIILMINKFIKEKLKKEVNRLVYFEKDDLS
ncbi:hypothetical protein [Dehalobacterium formicoaceticum]|uniref:Uncharacterized protein n=1 Tax=Dehalobacterium formicoaceticum TaxID=51515 RepID=A0ABT1Y664_9FIRM|nr:hypothetical protein [Dehalobacterium formicoaceticum]MCR6546357.1 hypothetical protein [Dehalobacterium formicoaceticum]